MYCFFNKFFFKVEIFGNLPIFCHSHLVAIQDFVDREILFDRCGKCPMLCLFFDFKCTDVKMIAQNSFCTSADSTSWLSGVKYGWFDDGNQKAHINQFRKDLIEQRLSAVRTITEGRGLELTDKTLLYGARASLCATICKQKYTRAAGSQE